MFVDRQLYYNTSERKKLIERPGVGITIGDAVELRTERPGSDIDAQSSFYCEYKNSPTYKYNVISIGGTDLCIISRGYPGSVTDNGIHNNKNYDERMISGDASTKMVYMYDKGLTDRFELERIEILVFTPRKRQKGQLAFSGERADNDRDIAKERINIERNMEVFRNIKGFSGGNKRLSEIDLSDHEAQVAREFVKLNAPITDW
ncbi:hypothetical protein SARC_03033 [Sphaeroforma arctica JP610]|uniref:DDE Tnp4 domain-containing protein n=1 Tax=Sphaeroforma arctica JP610 TaxID=667725 RepID=A0A0L0G6V7_9EUKA|nr:hypothetical protein SARC_03033 [Sphaeroforma arctica JP610]KNC84762.1 hypothetical protein SARC_03033 [Sphaeroforma arctica JP610]|eukprot:XP_014158664.1 hypothetical protein SARC_03033 [Sphaeroforma arctica JP610]